MTHEIHHTLNPEQSSRFSDVVDQANSMLKSSGEMRLHTFLNRGRRAYVDAMTELAVSGSNDRALFVADAAKKMLLHEGLDVLRTKIERPAEHASAVANGEYYETHLKLTGVDPSADYKFGVGVKKLLLSTSLPRLGVHGTVRSFDATYAEHLARVHRICAGLLANRIGVLSMRHEHVWHDDNIAHDDRWKWWEG